MLYEVTPAGRESSHDFHDNDHGGITQQELERRALLYKLVQPWLSTAGGWMFNIIIANDCHAKTYGSAGSLHGAL